MDVSSQVIKPVELPPELFDLNIADAFVMNDTLYCLCRSGKKNSADVEVVDTIARWEIEVDLEDDETEDDAQDD